MKFGDHGIDVTAIQYQLICRGYDMPKYGPDGWFGSETARALEEYVEDNEDRFHLGEWEPEETEVPIEVLEALDHKAVPVNEPYMSDLVLDYRSYTAERDKVKGRKYRSRNWKDVTGITLHQMACDFGSQGTSGSKLEKIRRRVTNIRVHACVLREGEAIISRPLELRLPQAQAFNSCDVGIEVEGYYAGVEGDPKTFWKPKSQPNRKPMKVTDKLTAAGRALILFIMEEVARHGGEIKYVHAHRQTSASRISDPGSALWEALGIWAQEEFGLSDGGPDYYLRNGRPIPKEWDDRRIHGYCERPKK
jgi:hypothetical protein